MASIQKLFAFALAILLTLTTMTYATNHGSSASAMSLATRLKLEGESTNCWESLFQLQACTGEVIMFFLNGETYLGPSCCRAIRVVSHDCWPDMLGSLGFTSEEGDVLQGYCDAEKQHDDVPPPSPPSPTTIV